MNKISVESNGFYCCENKPIRVTDCPFTVTGANNAPIDVLYFPTGETDEANTVYGTLEPGGTLDLTTAGVYMLDIDCKNWDLVKAPDGVADQVNVSCVKNPLADPTESQLTQLCIKLEQLIQTTATTAIAASNGLVDLNYCTDDGKKAVHCVKKDPDTGDIVGFNTFVLDAAIGELVPHDGSPLVDCTPKQYNTTEQCVGDPDSPHCGKSIFYCQGLNYVRENGQFILLSLIHI